MARYHFICIPILLFFVSCQPVREAIQRVDRPHLDSLFEAHPDFSGVVLLATDGKPEYHKAFGYKDFNSRVPMDTNAIFEWASVSKQFTAMTIMMLNEQGLLSYDDPVEKYIPGLPYNGVTIRHLLNHTSGLPDYQTVMDAHWDKSSVAGNEENIEYLIRYRPERNFAPGVKYEYSNTGYMLLASIAEKGSGKDFIELCHDRIFEPLAMDQTEIRTRSDKANLSAMALGHLFVPEKQTYVHADSFPAFNYSIWLGNRKGPGRVSGSASDLLKWDQALYTEKLVRKETLEEAYAPARLNNGTASHYGFGWMLSHHPTLGKVVLHTGDNPGYRTIIIRFIEANKTVVVLCNNEHEKFHDIVKAISDIAYQN